MQLFVVIVLLLALLFITGARSSKYFKGKIGENKVSRILKRLPTSYYTVFDDILLPTIKGTTQIDHIVVSIYGIFVIETKNYSGWIYGGEHSEYWTQNIYGRPYRFYNPILQNASHIRAIKRQLAKYGDLPIISIVAFSSRARFKSKFIGANVVYWNELKSTIKSYRQKLIDEDIVETICLDIQHVKAKMTKENVKHHKHNVRATVNKKRNAIAAGRCPRCGGELVLRSGQYGKFYGCSNFPRCRYAANDKRN